MLSAVCITSRFVLHVKYQPSPWGGEFVSRVQRAVTTVQVKIAVRVEHQLKTMRLQQEPFCHFYVPPANADNERFIILKKYTRR